VKGLLDNVQREDVGERLNLLWSRNIDEAKSFRKMNKKGPIKNHESFLQQLLDRSRTS